MSTELITMLLLVAVAGADLNFGICMPQSLATGNSRAKLTLVVEIRYFLSKALFYLFSHTTKIKRQIKIRNLNELQMLFYR